MSIAAFAPFYREGRYDDPAEDIAVIDNVLEPSAYALQDFSERHRLPFYTMPINTLKTLRIRSITSDLRAAYSRLLQATFLPTATHWITGRYHGLVAAMCAGRRFCTMPSNTHKIQGLLIDAGLDGACLLPDNWHKQSETEQDWAVSNAFATWDSGHDRAISAYIKDAEFRIQRMFDELAQLARSKRA